MIDEHWQGSSHSSTPDRSLPLPRNVACYAIAASSQTKPASASSSKSARGDGLVPLDSALGHHKNAAFALGFPAAHQHVVYGIDHFQLLSSAEVYAQLYAWLKTS